MDYTSDLFVISHMQTMDPVITAPSAISEPGIKLDEKIDQEGSSFVLSEETCGTLYKLVDRYTTSADAVKLFPNVTAIYEFSSSVGELFENNTFRDSDTMNPSESTYLLSKIPSLLHNICNSIHLKSVQLTPQLPDGKDESGEKSDFFDFSRCFILGALVQYYQNTFPFKFNLPASFIEKLSSNPLMNYDDILNIPIETEISQINESEEANTTENNESPLNGYEFKSIYVFQNDFKTKESDPNATVEYKDMKFPHCVYNGYNDKNFPFIPLFGNSTEAHIKNGTYLLEEKIKGKKSIFLLSNHALCDAIIDMSFILGEPVYEILACQTIAENNDFKEKLSTEPNTLLNLKYCVLQLKSNDKQNDFIKNHIRSSHIFHSFGIVCKLSIFKKIMGSYISDIQPLLSNPKSLDTLSSVTVDYAKRNSVWDSHEDYENYDNIHLLKDENTKNVEFEKFKTNFLDKKCVIRVVMRYNILAFPNGYQNNYDIMCGKPTVKSVFSEK